MMGWLAHHYSHTKDHQNKTPSPLSTNKENIYIHTNQLTKMNRNR